MPEGSELKAAIHKLLVRKKAGEEMDYEPRINPINEFLEDRLVYYEGMASSLPVAEVTQDAQLDRLFRAALQEVWEETGRCL
ncbi:hypothetical protein D3C71_2149890 [compost metagenome]